jgi:hypothetical protein
MTSKIEKDTQNNNIYLKIVEGSLRQAVREGTPDSIDREWSVGGEKGVAHEVVHKAAFGIIKNIAFFDGERDGRKFTTLNITLDENEEGKTPVIGVGLGTKYAQDVMKKFPSIDFSQEVRIRPFSFVPEGEDKNVIGVEITQRDSQDKFTKRVDNHFIEKKSVDGVEKWLPTNGFPKREKPYDDQTDEEKEIYKIQCRMFLIKSTKELIAKQFTKLSEDAKEDADFDSFTKQEPPSILKRQLSKEEVEQEIDIDSQPF